MSSRRLEGTNWPLVAVTIGIVAVAARSATDILSSDTLSLLHRHVADDGFYYFDLARNFPTPEVTAGIRTTGFHPLWWLVLAAPFQLLDGMAPVRVALLILLVTHLVIGIVIYRLVSRSRLGHWPGALAALVWIASPYLRQISLTGVEAPIAVLVVLVYAACMRNGVPDWRRGAVAGALAGLAVVARLDAAVIVAVIAVERIATTTRGANGSYKRLLSPGVLAFFGTAAVVVAPWVAYLATHGGLPDSARALRILRGHGVDIGQGGVRKVLAGLVNVLTSALDPFGTEAFAMRVIAAVVVVLLVVAAARWAPGRAWCKEWRGLLAGVLMLEALYATVLGGTRIWYHLYAAGALWLVVMPAGIGAVQDAAAKADPARFRLAGGVAVAATAVLVVGREPLFYPQEADKYLATVVAPRYVPRGETVGSFNSGVYTFFLPRRDVNLDGVVNPRVQPAVDHRTLCQYLKTNRISWLLDSSHYRVYFEYFAPGARMTDVIDLSNEYRQLDPYDVSERQILVKLDTSGC